jgi:hypothetical protein
MAVLEHNPLTFQMGLLNEIFGFFVLTLTERNWEQLLLEIHICGKLKKLRCWIRTLTKDENERRLLVDVLE